MACFDRTISRTFEAGLGFSSTPVGMRVRVATRFRVWLLFDLFSSHDFRFHGRPAPILIKKSSSPGLIFLFFTLLEFRRFARARNSSSLPHLRPLSPPRPIRPRNAA